MRSALAGSSAAALLALGALGCTAPRHLPEAATTWRSAGGLQAAQPMDVAVAPVRNQSGDGSVPVGRLRELLYERLADRLYSPIDLDYVDAELVVSITGWRDDLLVDTGLIAAGADVYFFAPGSSSEPLWGVSITRRLDLGVAGPGQGPGKQSAATLNDRAIELLADEILALIPERDPEAEPGGR